MRRIGFPLALMLAVFLATAVAQDNKMPATSGGAPQRHRAQPQQTGPTAMPDRLEIYKMRGIVGEWTTIEKYVANELSPRVGTGTGRARLLWGPGRTSIIQSYRSRNKVIGNFAGHSTFFWDAKAGDYKTFWCDSGMGCMAQLGSGKWEGDKLIFTSEADYMGKKLVIRDIFSDIKPDSFTMANEISVDGGPMEPFMSIQYKRATTPAPAKAEAR